MKILYIFCDMLRAERLQSVNPQIKEKTPIDRYFERLGGTCFTNAYTPAPDTSRSLACFQTGLMPNKNGCRKYVQYAADYLETDEHIFKTLYQQGYKIHALVTPFGPERGDYAHDFFDYVTPYYDFRRAIEAIKKCNSEKQVTYLVIDDYHDAIDISATLWGHKTGQKHLSNAFSILFDEIPVDYFDDIFIFSDHGCTLDIDYPNPRINKLNDYLSKITLFWHRKGDSTLKKDNHIVSILDIYPTTLEILKLKPTANIDGVSLFTPDKERFIVMENNILSPDAWNNILTLNGVWAFRNRDYFFVQTIDQDYYLHLDANYRLQKVVNGNYLTIHHPPQALLDDFRHKIEIHSCHYREFNRIRKQRERRQNFKIFSHLLPATSYGADGGAIAYADGQPYEKKPILPNMKREIKKNVYDIYHGLSTIKYNLTRFFAK